MKLLTLVRFFSESLNPLSANPTKWSNILKQFVGELPTNCLSVFDHFVGMALKGLMVEENPLVVTVTVLHLVLAKLIQLNVIL